jgi:hypothetical protein
MHRRQPRVKCQREAENIPDAVIRHTSAAFFSRCRSGRTGQPRRRSLELVREG